MASRTTCTLMGLAQSKNFHRPLRSRDRDGARDAGRMLSGFDLRGGQRDVDALMPEPKDRLGHLLRLIFEVRQIVVVLRSGEGGTPPGPAAVGGADPGGVALRQPGDGVQRCVDEADVAGVGGGAAAGGVGGGGRGGGVGLQFRSAAWLLAAGAAINRSASDLLTRRSHRALRGPQRATAPARD